MDNVSLERKEYLKNIKIRNNIIIISRFLIIFLFISLWQIAINLNILNSFLTSSPINVIKTIFSLLKQNMLLSHLFITIYEIIICILISYTLSLFFASIFWYYPILYEISKPYLTILNSLPKVSLGPLIIIWIGSGMKSIIVMGIIISIFVTTINIYTSFSNTNKNYILLFNTFSKSRIKLLFKIIIPSNINNLCNHSLINLSMNFIGVIMGELLVSKKGLGYLISYGSSVFQLDLVITSIIILSLLSFLMYLTIELKIKK